MPALRLALLLALLQPAAFAVECPSIVGGAPALSTVDAAARVRFLQTGLRHAARSARVWAWSSAGIYLAAGNLQLLGATHVPDRGDQIDLYVGAASLSLGLFQLAAFSPRVMFDQPRLDARIRQALTVEDCALLASAEQWLLRDAASETFGRGPAMHAMTAAFSIAVGLVLGIVFNRWTSAAINIFLGFALGEVQILTQPTESIDLLTQYRTGNL